MGAGLLPGDLFACFSRIFLFGREFFSPFVFLFVFLFVVFSDGPARGLKLSGLLSVFFGAGYSETKFRAPTAAPRPRAGAQSDTVSLRERTRAPRLKGEILRFNDELKRMDFAGARSKNVR